MPSSRMKRKQVLQYKPPVPTVAEGAGVVGSFLVVMGAAGITAGAETAAAGIVVAGMAEGEAVGVEVVGPLP